MRIGLLLLMALLLGVGGLADAEPGTGAMDGMGGTVREIGERASYGLRGVRSVRAYWEKWSEGRV